MFHSEKPSQHMIANLKSKTQNLYDRTGISSTVN
jgi:hypothetical protein